MNIKKRQAEGIEDAKIRGVKFGRPKAKIPEEFPVLVTGWEKGTVSFARCGGISEATFYRRLKVYRVEQGI